MIKVGFITSPLLSGHLVRGVGFYTKLLLENLRKYSSNYEVNLQEISSSNTQHNDFNLIHYPFFDLFNHTLPLFSSCPTVVTIHDVIPLEYPNHYPPGIRGSINLNFQKLALTHVNSVITDSYSSVKSIHHHLHVPQSKIKMIFLAPAPHFKKVSDQKYLKVVKSKYHLPDKFILYVGDINWNKNITSLVLACQQINTPLVIVGKQAAQLETLDLSHPELIHLKPFYQTLIEYPKRLGFVSDSDLVGIYNLATIYCQPSLAEGFGLPVLESMACGTPTVVSQTSSLPEIARDSALYFDPYNVSSLINTLTNLYNNPKLRQDLSKSGLRNVKNYSWDKVAQETLKVYCSSI